MQISTYFTCDIKTDFTKLGHIFVQPNCDDVVPCCKPSSNFKGGSGTPGSPPCMYVCMHVCTYVQYVCMYVQYVCSYVIVIVP